MIITYNHLIRSIIWVIHLFFSNEAWAGSRACGASLAWEWIGEKEQGGGLFNSILPFRTIMCATFRVIFRSIFIYLLIKWHIDREACSKWLFSTFFSPLFWRKMLLNRPSGSWQTCASHCSGCCMWQRQSSSMRRKMRSNKTTFWKHKKAENDDMKNLIKRCKPGKTSIFVIMYIFPP